MNVSLGKTLHVLMGEERPILDNYTKKKIVARKKPVASNNTDYEEDTYIPLVANDSEWTNVGLKKQPKDCATEEVENEIQIIELEDGNEGSPLFQLFPHLQHEISNFETFNQCMSTTNVTKMLVGRKANFSLLKSCQKLRVNVKLNPINEDSESESEKRKAKKKLMNRRIKSHSMSSIDGDIDSDED